LTLRFTCSYVKDHHSCDEHHDTNTSDQIPAAIQVVTVKKGLSASQAPARGFAMLARIPVRLTKSHPKK
jgi:hypothetical protein